MKRVVLTACAVLLCSASVGMAQTPPKDPGGGGGDTCLETVQVIDCVEIAPDTFKCTVIAKKVPCD